MRRYVTVGVLVSSIVLACDGDDGPECVNIAGNWSVRSERTTGTCDLTFGNQTLEITMRRDSGQWEAVLPLIQNGCRGQFDQAACRFTATCDVLDGASRRIITTAVDWSFDGGAFSGTSLTAAFNPLVNVNCTANYRDVGTRL